MNITAYRSWHDFARKFIEKYTKLSQPRQRQLVFRGQADSRWPLRTTLDRLRLFSSVAERERCLSALIAQFQRHARSLSPLPGVVTELEWELLGRHHGLPTSVLDFTRSPYVAAYFAYAEPRPTAATHASLWMLDLEAFIGNTLPQVAVIDEEESIRYNPRAQEQRGLFLKVKDVGSVEELLGDYLTRHDIPVDVPDRVLVLGVLNGMLINARGLFRDMDSAARTAITDVLLFGEG